MSYLLSRIWHIIHKESLVGKREKQEFLASLLFLASITFVIFKVFGSLEGPTRMGIFWIVLLFTSINIVWTSFGTSLSKRRLTHYQLYDPMEYLIAKLTVNYLKLLIAGTLLLLFFILFSNKGLQDLSLFVKVYVLASFGLVVTLTFISSLSIYSGNQNSLVSVLSLPLIIPILIISMKVSLVSERMFVDTAVDSNLLMLLGIDLLLLVMALIFISFTWKP